MKRYKTKIVNIVFTAMFTRITLDTGFDLLSIPKQHPNGFTRAVKTIWILFKTFSVPTIMSRVSYHSSALGDRGTFSRFSFVRLVFARPSVIMKYSNILNYVIAV